MKAEIKKWENIILSGKKIEPKNKSEQAYFDIAEYFILKDISEKKAA